MACADCEILRAEKASLTTQLREARDAIAELHAKIREKNLDVEEKNAKIRNKSTKIQQHEGTIKKRNDQIKSLEAEIAKLKEEKEEADKMAEGMGEELFGVSEELDNEKEKVGALEASLDDERANFASLKTEMNDVKGTMGLEIKAHVRNIETLESVKTDLVEKMNDLERKNGSLATSITTMNETIASQASDIATMSTNIAAMNETVASQASEIATLSTKNVQLTTELADAQSKMESDTVNHQATLVQLNKRYTYVKWVCLFVSFLLSVGFGVFVAPLIYNTIANYFAPPPVPSIEPPRVPSLAAIARLQAAVQPICLKEAMSIGRDWTPPPTFGENFVVLAKLLWRGFGANHVN
ncbi:hypothetical protein HYFRA_00013754 [Hymenoscyphus fraxineus]|uniref:Uncharacterized protein n=1 Tax=Hymenoscyphus fraxineus TaxID=746836 RepID=A0A9N9LAB6_9HELO|nr:hypothetical protein HYFRA_00013754 [Hymenoscyphus fraxineus]